MAKVRGICKNIDGCVKAEKREIQELEKSAPFVCQEEGCGKPLTPVKPPPSGNKLLILIVAAVIIVAGGGTGAYFLLNNKSENNKPEIVDEPVLQSVTLNPSSLELTVGESGNLNYTVEPANFPTADFIWSSSDESVATVNNNGAVKALSSGETQISFSNPEETVAGHAVISVKMDTNVLELSTVLSEGHVVDNGNGSGSISTEYGKYTGEIKDGKAHGNGSFQFFKALKINRHSERISEEGDNVVGLFENNEIVTVKWFDKNKQQKGAIIR